MSFILLLLKVFLIGQLLSLVIGVVNLIFISKFKILNGKAKRWLAAVIVFCLNAYLYCFWGGYLASIISAYSEKYNRWLLIVICIVSIIPIVRIRRRQFAEQMTKWEDFISETEPLLDLIEMNEETSRKHYRIYYNQASELFLLCMVLVLPASFVVFLFSESIYKTLFFNYTDYLSRLFL
jgi:hypothetical protein